MESNLSTVLDKTVEDIMVEFPEKSEFEASFTALRLQFTAMAQKLNQIGMTGNGLDLSTLYWLCLGLTETCFWMAAKEMAAQTMRDIDKLDN